MSRINAYSETSNFNSDDFLVIDGTTSGTRKIKPNNIVPANSIPTKVNFTKYGTTSFPYGWRTGYYPTGGGSVTNSAFFICTLLDSIPVDDVTKVTVVPPTGYAAAVQCIKKDGTVVQIGNANTTTHPENVDVPITFYTADYIGYNVTFGRFVNQEGTNLVKNKVFCESLNITEDRKIKYVNAQNVRLTYSKSELNVGSLQTASKIISTVYTEAFAVGSNNQATLIPLEEFKSVTLYVPPLSGKYYKYRVGFYDNNGSQIGYISSTTETTFAQRKGGAYIAVGVYAYNESDDTVYKDFLATFSDDVLPLTITKNDEYVYSYVSEEDVTQIVKSDIDAIINKTDVLSLNPDAESQIKQALRPINLEANGYLTVNQPLALAWMSDIHGDAVELDRFVSLSNKLNSYLDDSICTGDLVNTRWSDGISFWNNVEGSENILIVIGNHDILTADSTYDWTQRASQSQQYARYIEPFYNNWNISSDVATNGLTYYYKDYANKGVRLIVINEMLDGEDLTSELTWFTSVLSEAITNNLNVVIAKHCPLYNSTKLECNWSNIDRYSTTSYLPTGSRTIFTDAVDTFISNGGKFICYICGHTHWDQISKFVGTNGTQLSIGIDALNRAQANQYSDTQRTDGTKSQDLINVIVFDTASECIKVIRMGADKDHYLRPKNTIAINYDGTIISET